MKKYITILGVLLAGKIFSQTEMSLLMQNYTPYQVEFTIWKENWGTNHCNDLYRSSSIHTSYQGLAPLLPGNENMPVEAFYWFVLSSSQFVPTDYPATPTMQKWSLTGNGYLAPNVQPTSALNGAAYNAFSTEADWAGIKFGLSDKHGNPLEGYYSMYVKNTQCSPVPNLPHNNPIFQVDIPSQSIRGDMFTLGEQMWMVFHNL